MEEAKLRVSIQQALLKAGIPYMLGESTESLQEKLDMLKVKGQPAEDLLGEFEKWAVTYNIAVTPNIMMAFTAGYMLCKIQEAVKYHSSKPQ